VCAHVYVYARYAVVLVPGDPLCSYHGNPKRVYVRYAVVLVPGDPLCSYRGNLKRVCVHMCMCMHVML